MILSEGFSGVQIGWRESNIRRSSGGGRGGEEGGALERLEEGGGVEELETLRETTAFLVNISSTFC